VLEIPYQNVFAFTNSANASIRFALNSQCVNMLLAVNRADTYATLAVANASGTSNYFTFAVGNSTTYQWQVDNVYMPSYPIDCINASPLQYQYVKQAFGDHNNVLGFDNLIQSFANRYGQALTLANCRTAVSSYNFMVALNLNVSNGDSRLLSGYNSAGSNAQFFLNMAGSTGAFVTTVFAMCSSVLRVSAGRLIEIVV
jgi:hypothetical protein